MSASPDRASPSALTARRPAALKAAANAYETQEFVQQYLLFHYGAPRDLCPLRFIPLHQLRFHRRLLRECVLPISFAKPTRALDIGCAVGRFTFELGRVVDQVLGIDRSAAFIEAARQMAQSGGLPVRVKESGDSFKTRALKLPAELRRGSVGFQVGDAEDPALFSNPPAHLVAAINLICRLSCPRQFLARLERLVVPGGQLIVASPFSWLADYTSRNEWLTPRDVTAILRPHFRLIRRRELPFFIREHRRKYELVVSQVSTYVRR